MIYAEEFGDSGDECFSHMFANSFEDGGVPESIPAFYVKDLSTAHEAFNKLYKDCGGLKFSETQTEECKYEWALPITKDGTGNPGSELIVGTGGTYTGEIEINKTYYVNVPVSKIVPSI